MISSYGYGAVRGRLPVVTIALVAINILVFLYMLTLGGLDRDIFIWKFGLIPFELTEGQAFERLSLFGPDITSPVPTWGTVFTSMFVHGGVLHIIGNMLFLYGFGERLETKLGPLKYLVFYLATGVAAAWTQVAIDLDSRAPMIGASGAVFGVVAAHVLAFPYRNALGLLFIFLILPMIFGLGSFSPLTPGAGVAYMAHLGGLVAGVLLMSGYMLLVGEPIQPQRLWGGRSWPPWQR